MPLMVRFPIFFALIALIVQPLPLVAQDEPFSRMDVFDLQWVEDPQVSPDGETIAYVRRSMDIREDRRTGNIWKMDVDGTNHIKLSDRDVAESSPRWSPDGSRIAFVSTDDDDSAEIYLHWVEEGRTARISQLERSPGSVSWSPDGEKLAFSMHVPESSPTMVTPPDAPDGAEWAEPARVETRLNHELDGTGYLEYGYSHLFVMSSEGGSKRQLTSGEYHHGGTPMWTPDGEHLIFSANLHDDWEQETRNTEIHRLHVDSGSIQQLTDRYGPNHTPRVSPDGSTIAYLGFEDEVQTYQTTYLWTMNLDGSGMQKVETGVDRSFDDVYWDEDGSGFYVQYEDEGNTKIGHVSAGGAVEEVANNLGGTSIGRPYGGGDFSVSGDGLIVMNQTTPYHPAELAVTRRGQGDATYLTDLNGDLLDRRELGETQEVWYTSTEDGRDLHGWVVTPPDYEEGESYPLIVELHGGPINNYGDRFSPEVQLYAAAGYVVFYPNFRGSTSYGEEFGNLLYHDFSGGEYQDIMDGVDLMIEEGYTSEGQLYITGGSAGGTAAAWAIGQTDRFEAAAVQKPVMNWISKTLAADNYYAYYDRRYPGFAWENPMAYWDVSPISLVGEVETPTMLIVGEDDRRTPTWEALQLYHALQLRGVDTVYVELPGAPHNMASRPSQLITKVDHVLAWFDEYR